MEARADFLDKYLDARLNSIEQTLRTEITNLHETLQREIVNLSKSLDREVAHLNKTVDRAVESNARLVEMVQAEVHSQNERIGSIEARLEGMRWWILGTGLGLFLGIGGLMYALTTVVLEFLKR